MGPVHLAVVGAHLSGQPLNVELTARGATLVATTTTAPCYRLVALATVPPKPGLIRTTLGDERGGAIEVEVYELDVTAFGEVVASVPAPLCIGRVVLADGSDVRRVPVRGRGRHDGARHHGVRGLAGVPCSSRWPRLTSRFSDHAGATSDRLGGRPIGLAYAGDGHRERAEVEQVHERRVRPQHAVALDRRPLHLGDRRHPRHGGYDERVHLGPCGRRQLRPAA